MSEKKIYAYKNYPEKIDGGRLLFCVQTYIRPRP